MMRRSKECVYVREHLDAFADNELTKRELAKVVMHLIGCTLCTEELLSIRELTNMLAGMCVVRPALDLTLKVQKLVTAESSMRANASTTAVRAGICRRTWSWNYATCVGAAAVFVLGFWTSWEMPYELTNLFAIPRTKNVLAPSDCYVANQAAVINQTQVITDDIDDESSSLITAIGLKSDEDGLYVVEM